MESKENCITVKDILNAKIVFESDDKCTSCAAETEAVEKEIASTEKEYKDLRQNYYDMLVENIKKDVEIDELELKIQEKSNYTEFTEHFSENSMKFVRLLKNKEAEDSKFVLAVVRGLYEDRLEDLKKKNLSGRSKATNKEPVTPEKMATIRSIFAERTKGSAKSDERGRNLRKLIKSAIETINKKQH